MAAVEVLIDDPPCLGCVQSAALAQRISASIRIKWILKYTTEDDAIPKFEGCRTYTVLAMAIDEMIRIMGFCSGVGAFENALWGMGAAAEIGDTL